MRERLIRAARAFDAALFVAALTAVLLWGWPSTAWGQLWVVGSALPFVAWCLWAVWRRWRDARVYRETLAYRRAKFGGFATTREVRDGKRVVVPLERPDQ